MYVIFDWICHVIDWEVFQNDRERMAENRKGIFKIKSKKSYNPRWPSTVEIYVIVLIVLNDPSTRLIINIFYRFNL
jgi:hypothetical protein